MKILDGMTNIHLRTPDMMAWKQTYNPSSK